MAINPRVEWSHENKMLIDVASQNNTFIRQCNLFAYHKYMPTHSQVCCQSPGMILIRNINGRCPENMLVLVPIISRSMVAAILFNFCGR